MGVASAVDWWEEWQLRILVLGSQSVQWILFFYAPRRKSGISAPFRFLIWLAYLGSDAMVIYALAALFNRQRKHYANPSFPHGSSVLEVVWAPVLLMHLGGQYCITAYNMEDNELWRRHALVAVSQITVSIYVFCKAWSGGDKKLLQAAIMLFTLGGIRCLEKPFALQNASINSLVSSSDAPSKLSGNKGSNTQTISLEDYVKKVRALYQAADHEGDAEANHRSEQAQGEGDIEANQFPDQAEAQDDVQANRLPEQAQGEGDIEANQLSNQAEAQDDVQANPLPEQAQGEGDIEANQLPNQAEAQDDVQVNPLPEQAQGEGDIEANQLPNQAEAQDDVQVNPLPEQAQGEGDIEANQLPNQVEAQDDVQANPLPEQAQGSYFEGGHLANQVEAQDDVHVNPLPEQAQGYGYFEAKRLSREQVRKLFVDLVSPYPDRLSVTESFLKLDGKTAYELLQKRLSHTFDLLYTKAKMVWTDWDEELSFSVFLAQMFRFACIILPFAAIGLFHQSHREAYDENDVKVTYTLLCCTAVMELFSYPPFAGRSKLSSTVAQYSFMGFYARNKKYTTRMSVMSALKCKEYANQQCSMEPVDSSSKITMLVHQQVKGWWKQHIRDAADYRRFNNHRGQWAIQQAGCGRLLGWSIRRSFDESVLLWHIATDLCFYNMGVRSMHSYAAAKGCREISKYMMYLLFAKPGMLMAGTRRNLLKAAYGQLNSMLGSWEQPSVDEERAIAQRLITKVEESPKGSYFVHDAWDLAKTLLALNDLKKMWEMIQGVWVEMLCYSASRCRGYLHAKSLGTGGELLTFVWLLWSQMGMETLGERMQMPDVDQMPDEEPPSEGENGSSVEVISPLIVAGSSQLEKINQA